MDQPRPDTTPEPESASEPAMPSARDDRIALRLASLVGPDETIVLWTRAWVSREIKAHRMLAARTLDFAVLTERSLLLYSTGFFTRRARRPVYASRLDRLVVVDDTVRRGRRLRVTARQSHPLWIELNGTARAHAFADALVARGRSEDA